MDDKSASDRVADRPRAAIYARISADRDGDGLGVERQVADCQALADRLGWDAVAIYIDNNISAASGKVRPEYRRMLDDVRAGRVDAILAWHTDRLHRRPVELEEFIGVAEAHRLLIQTVKAGTVDLSTPSGQMVARMLGAAARHEVDQTRTRIAAQKLRAAQAGEYRGGPRPFGYEKDGMRVREPEAAMVLEATRAVLAGRSLRGIATEWNEAGKQARRRRFVRDDAGQKVRDERGRTLTRIEKKEWTALTVRELLLRPRNAGILAHGMPDRKASDATVSRQRGYEELGAAKWPAIVPEDEWRAVVAHLMQSSRRSSDGVRDRKHLGSGLYVCGGRVLNADGNETFDEAGDPVVCGTLMRSGTHGGGHGHYRCRLPGKGHVMVVLEKTDELVRREVAELIRDPRVVAALTPAAPDLTADRERQATLRARLGRFERDYIEGNIDGAQRKKAETVVQAEINEIEAKIAAAVRRSTSSDVLSAVDPGQAFLDAPLDVQRSVVASVVRVQIEPNMRRGSAWTEARVKFSPSLA
ncbi:recombinase family protein [Microbacterium sp. EYE_5]|uniref:recombinase family protein n=1 Tax=unclassified Microbacterium TaxID=2609290 RepID=UPI00200308DA|nr:MULTISPECIES: recombinase family protein [unclassified Microbacterium]MCK6081487.1 recombinase family protein [Microbacterium sp. EYE_382]MCK6086757.1 recombinase family protein [Microbacterium sp. EYE_384]MCK6123745.1 recombinase family protein [Microbacterium sp. EYE_80]MCK6126654.1 recombinase family protein [Microbacterium sp. EYE_79]MCK6142442.1 recombinase family protein [Microbacterium sp. EYE_39]